MGEAKYIRAFLAIEVPRDTMRVLESVQQRLRNLTDGFRWSRVDGIHLTLKFFGDILPDDADRIPEIVREHVVNVPPLNLSLGDLGGFPSLERPRVLWVGAGDDIGRLKNLQLDIEGGLRRYGFPVEARPFAPHLTLGRSRSHLGSAFEADKLRAMAGELGRQRFEVRELVLFKSDLRPSGPVYTRLACIRLGDSALLDG